MASSLDDRLLHPVAREGLAILRKYAPQYGIRFRENSGFRSITRQRELYNLWKSGSPLQRLPVAVPGTSTHNYGLAVDVQAIPPTTQAQLAQLMTAIGWVWPDPKGDPVHFQVIDPATFRGLLKQANII